jgi:hypothetical protein
MLLLNDPYQGRAGGPFGILRRVLKQRQPFDCNGLECVDASVLAELLLHGRVEAGAQLSLRVVPFVAGRLE